MFKLFKSQNIAHYHGDEVRRLFVGTAALSLIAIPVVGNLLPLGIGFQIWAAIVLVLLAGFTAPHSTLVMIVNTLVAALGVFLLEAAAVSYYGSDSLLLFVVREAAAVMLLFALYGGIKTLRAMMQGTLGHASSPTEFEQHKK